ncbi:hypothetical protein RPX00_07155 [Amycolatopsis sp. WGS_07]
MRTDRKGIVPAMLRTHRCDWYLLVLRPGTVPTAELESYFQSTCGER